jgi:hypothetical protein
MKLKDEECRIADISFAKHAYFKSDYTFPILLITVAGKHMDGNPAELSMFYFRCG